jgi:BirA family biotin operon repressor/biotin-[acetyl-CoA-carboxylase] ligase
MEKNIILLNMGKIQSFLDSKELEIELFDEIDSTNRYLKSLQHNCVKICIAEAQTQGRGRLHRNWYSPFGQNIYMSMLYPFSSAVQGLSGLSLVIGLSLCYMLDELYQSENPFLIKWPNDIIYNGQKLGGILIEIITSHDTCNAIIGVGLNVNMEEDDNQITQGWTSLKKITQENCDRNKICGYLINYLLNDIEAFSQHGLTPFLEKWQAKDSLFHNPVKVQNNSVIYAGRGLGINNMGQLLLETAEGKVLQFSSGDTMIIRENFSFD